jgi:hypothetical protein
MRGAERDSGIKKTYIFGAIVNTIMRSMAKTIAPKV